jgi:sulfur carrier protein
VTTVLINGEERRLAGPTTVAHVVELLGCGTKGVAVAVNDEIVARSRWSDHDVGDGDRVEVVRAAQGG